MTVDEPRDSAAKDPVLAVLDELVAAGRENVHAWMQVLARVDAVRELRRQGVAYKDMEIAEGDPIVSSVAMNQERLTSVGTKLRRVVAQQLHAEGMSAAGIARAFGVSRQRIASILGHDAADEVAESVVAPAQRPASAPQHPLSS